MNKAYLFKIKEGKKDLWYNWCQEISTSLRAEALSTLEEEQVLHELTLGISLPEGDYVVGYMDGECLPANQDREINKRHNIMKEECLERIGPVDILYDLKR
jgi:hypothetical protein